MGCACAVLSVKLKHLDKWTDERITAARKYTALLNSSKFSFPHIPKGEKHVFHLYVVQTDDRGKSANSLLEQGIATAIHYPTPMPAMPCYDYLATPPENTPSQVPYASEFLSLPMFAELMDEEVQRTAQLLNDIDFLND